MNGHKSKDRSERDMRQADRLRRGSCFRRWVSLSVVILWVTSCAAIVALKKGETTAYGGSKVVEQNGTGYFRTALVDGRWWLIDPDGGLFFSKGVNHISFTADRAPSLGYSPYRRCVEEKYGTEDAWASASIDRLRSWGFNTIGAWSGRSTFHKRMPYTVILNLAAQAGGDWLKGSFPDVFSERFRDGCKRVAARQCSPRASDPYLIGYFTDNELAWGPDWRRKDSLLIGFLKADHDTAGHTQALRFLKERYDSAEALGAAWNVNLETFENLKSTRLPGNDRQRQDETDFQYLAARQYFRVCHEIIRESDPNHLIIGVRFAGRAPESVLRAAVGYIDVVSFNNYSSLPPSDRLAEIHEITGRPVMLTEFSFKAMDSGLPNTRGAGRPVQTQEDRANGFEAYVTALAQTPFVVGYHWFEYVDEPAEGRFDGENSNYGLVKINDEPWELLVGRMTKVNSRIDEIHSKCPVQ